MSLHDCTVLLVTTRRWHTCARLAMALSEAGCTVDVVCPGNHSVLKTSVVRRVWLYRAFHPTKCLEKAIARSSPRLIVPCDDAATTELHALARSTQDDRLRRLVGSSLGDESSYAVTASRAGLHQLAEALGIAVPRASLVGPAMTLKEAIAAVGLPAFLKTDGSSGGTGVCRIAEVAGARAAYRKLTSPPSMLRAMKRAVVDGDLSLLPGAAGRKRGHLSLQQAVAGVEANSAIFCWRGQVMASITVEVVAASIKHGPSTVVRVVENAEIAQATTAIARRLGLSGLFGFDFILEEATGRAMLIEMNARPTQTSHLALGEGRDLAAAVFAALSRRPVVDRTPTTQKQLIALFPGEWLRDPSSIYLELGHHDLPDTEPELVQSCLRRPNLVERLLTVQGRKMLWESLRVLGAAPAGADAEPNALEVEELA